MNVRACLVLSLGVMVWASPAVALDPPEVPVHPQLGALYDAFSPPEIVDAGNGVWVARGYNRDNPVLIEGSGGLIIVDPGESVPAAEIVRSAFNAHLNDIFEKKPVKAVIYTHHHDCNIHGAAAFANKHTKVIAHENLMPTLYADWYSQVYPSRLIGGAYMSGSIFASDPDWFYGCGLFAVQHSGESGFIPPTKTVRDSLKTEIAGVKIHLYSAPGETRDVLVVWLPKRKTMVQIANLYEAFPAITTMRGAYPRDPLSYIDSIDFYRSLDPETLVLIHGPHPVYAGRETIQGIFVNYRDAIQYVHDQTVQYMNRGFTPGEIARLVTLPPHLAEDPFLQEVYGEVDRNIYEIFWWYRGYYTGECRDLFPQSPVQEANMAAMLAGGVGALAGKAGEALTGGELEWALELSDDVLLLDPENGSARATKNAAMLALAEGTMNAQTRNYLLSDYLLETRQASPAQIALLTGRNQKLAFSTMDENAVYHMPMDALHRIMAVSLNASKSLDVDMAVGLELTDMKKAKDAKRALHVRRGVLEVESQSYGRFTVLTDSLTWKMLVLGKLSPRDAVASDLLAIAGGTPGEFYDFMELFD